MWGDLGFALVHVFTWAHSPKVEMCISWSPPTPPNSWKPLLIWPAPSPAPFLPQLRCLASWVQWTAAAYLRVQGIPLGPKGQLMSSKHCSRVAWGFSALRSYKTIWRVCLWWFSTGPLWLQRPATNFGGHPHFWLMDINSGVPQDLLSFDNSLQQALTSWDCSSYYHCFIIKEVTQEEPDVRDAASGRVSEAELPHLIPVESGCITHLAHQCVHQTGSSSSFTEV